jgi:RND family efflux transporter MFP subunit
MMKKILNRVVIPGAITGLGILLVVAMFVLKPRADRTPPEPRVAEVEVLDVQLGTETVVLHASGLVVPAQEVTVIPEVSGRIVSQSSRLLPGGRFERGQEMARIDSRDYTLAMEQERSRVHQAELELELERGRGDIAAHEWEILGDGRAGGEVPLALREPHRLNAEQGLEAARSGLRRAEINLERTVLRAPFNAMVITEQVDVGQVVGPATAAVSLVGTDRFWVRIAVPVEKLAAIDIPGVTADEGSPARVTQRIGGDSAGVRRGEVIQLAGQLDPATRMAEILVAVDRPLEGHGIPLLPGAYVDVEIDGRDLNGAVTVPRDALVDGDQVWIVGAGNALIRRSVEVGWRSPDEVVITRGLEAGTRIVVSPMVSPVEGMPVRVEDGDAPADDGEGAS